MSTEVKIDFSNTEIAFAAHSDTDLKRAWRLFKIIRYNWLIRIGTPFVKIAFALHLPVKFIIRKTIFNHFCGGENIDDCRRTINMLANYHIGTILDYSVEGKQTEKDFNECLSQVLANIKLASESKYIPFCVFKPSGIARFTLLEKINAGENLSDDETEEFNAVKKRFHTIGEEAAKHGVPVFVDAEESWIQDIIDTMVTELMQKHNRERAIIYNTIQLYRTDRIDFLKKSIADAEANNYILGLKLVRGAYMEKERKRSIDMNYPSPIHPDKKSTDNDYNLALHICIRHLSRVAVCAGAHNEYSALLLTKLMQENNISREHLHIWFSQLYGMSDHISFNLARLGYNVCKYVPYGPVSAVMPYLIRRAQENTSVAGQTPRELSLLTAEMKRRKIATTGK